MAIMLFAFACRSEIVEVNDYPRLSEVKVNNISKNGVEVTVRYLSADFEITDHGFYFGPDEYLVQGKSEKRSLGPTEEEKFSTLISTNLVKGKRYYIRGFVEANGKIVLGPISSFISEGSNIHSVQDLDDKNHLIGDTIMVFGTGFSTRDNGNLLLIGTTQETYGLPDTDTSCRFIIPRDCPAGLQNAFFTIAEKTVSINNMINVLSPETIDFNPKSAAIGSTLTISGNNFSLQKDYISVTIGGVEAQVINSDRNSIRVTIPYIPISNALIEVQTGTLAAPALSGFNMLKTTITGISPQSGTFLDTLYIYGDNLDPRIGQYYISFNSNIEKTVSSTEQYIAVLVPVICKSREQQIRFELPGISIDCGTFTIDKLEVNGISPSICTRGTQASLLGSGFNPSLTKLLLDDERITLQKVENNRITFKMPYFSYTHMLDLWISNGVETIFIEDFIYYKR